MMALVRNAQQWALVAAAITEEWMERMGCPTDHQCSTSHWHSTSHQHSASGRRSRSLGWQEESPQVTPCCVETEARTESFQVTSHQGGTGDINLYEYRKTSQVMSCQRGAAQEQTWSPSSTRGKCWVTFTEGRVPSLGESPRHRVMECPHDTETQMVYQFPPPSRQMTEATPQEMADWARW